MDRVQLKNFVLLAQTLNFSAVAKQEFISQPALTKQINRLEEELGVTLFHRSKHGVSLTFAGEEFYKHAVEILDKVEKALHHMEHIRRGQTGSLELSAVFGLDDLISEGVSAFLQRFPEISVNIHAGTGSQQVQAINGQTADLYFSYAPMLDLFPGLESIPLRPDRFAIYLNRKDADAVRERGLSELDRLTHLIEYRSEGGPLFTGMIFSIRAALDLRSDNISYYSSNSTILLAVQTGMGFAFLPSQMNYGLCPENVVKLPIDVPEAEIRRALGWHRSNKNISVARFAEVARELAQTEAAAE